MVTKTEKNVKLFVDGKQRTVASPVEAFNDADGNLVVQFKVGMKNSKTGKSILQNFKLVFSEQHFIEIEEGESE